MPVSIPAEEDVTAGLHQHRGGGVNPPYFKSAISNLGYRPPTCSSAPQICHFQVCDFSRATSRQKHLTFFCFASK
jgi:hypothetical protein